jgi:hypothetical protein
VSKSTKKHYEKMPGGDGYFQSAAFNARTFEMYRQWLTAIALNRFRWINLPPSVSARMLEQTLYYNGSATISELTRDGERTGLVYALQAITNTQPNAQDDYDTWRSLGVNGFSYDSNTSNGVLVWDNKQRLPIAGVLDLFARRLTTLDRTIDVNMLQQRTPYLITGPQEKQLDVVNVLKQVAGGEPAVVGYDNVSQFVKVEALATPAPLVAEPLNDAWESIWSHAMMFLGLGSVPEKGDRLIPDEVDRFNMSASLTALDPLTCRREACDRYNEVFAATLVPQYGELSVVWAEDVESNTYNYDNDAEAQAEAEGSEID